METTKSIFIIIFLIFSAIYVADVAHETGLHFYRIPKLGSYLALLVEFKNYLNTSIFDQACE